MKLTTATVIVITTATTTAFTTSFTQKNIHTAPLHSLREKYETEVQTKEDMNPVQQALQSTSETLLDTVDVTKEPDVNNNNNNNRPSAATTTGSKNSNKPPRRMSESMPFMEVNPIIGTGQLAGDVGFDPLGLAKTTQDLWTYREAEVKHARLAMLAAAGWPLSELWDTKIATMLDMESVLLNQGDRAPSLLNGGLGKISPAYWVGCLVAAAAIDQYGIMKNSGKAPGTYTPGDYGLDVFGFTKDPKQREWVETAEIKNGRLAMLAITAFAVQEKISSVGVVSDTPFFFMPLNEAVQTAANSGYVQ